ncbi:MAG: NAD(P)-dependent alcohol dehydrogenase [Myxococcales bacterium]|nr:NAD(P)-dependent alcohol dehydrogenase [Myxococcales bacterium]
MQALAITQFGQTPTWQAVADPGPVPAGHVLLRVKAVGLNPADNKVLNGEFAGRFLHARKFPLVAGYDFSGIIESVGEGVTDLRVAQAVFGHLPYSGKNAQGALGEFLVVLAEQVAVKPDGVSHEIAAATATTASTALQSLRDLGHLAAGGRVLINGASGGVGSHGVQIARLLGAEVTATCSAAKMRFVESLGCDTVVDYRDTPMRALQGSFDVVFDAAGAASYGICAHLMAPAGVYVTTLPDAGLIWGKLLTLFSKRSAKVVVVQSRRADLTQLGEWLAAGQLRTPLEETYTDDEIGAALARMASREVTGKLAVTLR